MKSLARITVVGLAAALAIAPGPTSTAPEASHDNSFVVTAARVFDGEETISRATVVVRDGLIQAVAAEIDIPADLRVIDAEGMTLLPGLIDSHAHVFPGAQADALRFGVTAVLDMYHLGGSESAEAFRAHRESKAATSQADTWTSLAGVTPPGGHPSQMAEAWSVEIPTLAADEDAGAFVRQRVAEGADYIKIIQDDTVVQGTPLTKFSPGRLAEIIDAVHAQQRKAVVHVSAHDEALLAFDSGADMIAHVFQDRPAEPELVTLARERNAAVISTLSVLARASGTDHADRLVEDPRIAGHLSPTQQHTLAASFGSARPEILQHALESIGRFHAAGVPVLAGTDAPNPGTGHGVSIHQELELLVEAGLSPAAALNAATALPAAHLGLADRGRIRPGMRADLLLVEGDPTLDIAQTRQIRRIWKNGYEVDRRL